MSTPQTQTAIFQASRGGRCLAALLLVAGSTLTAPADLTHRYSFNDGSAADSIGRADGRLVNGASISSGRLVLANDGFSTDPSVGQYVALPANILHTRKFTLETWFTFNGGNPWQRLLDLGNSYGGFGQGFLILTLNGGYMPLGQLSLNSWGNPADTDYVAGNTFFPTTGEHALVYIHDTDAHYEELYLDGATIGAGYADVDPAAANYANFWIGRSQFSADPFYNGTINELRTYDNALSADQVLASYLAGPNATVPEPTACAILAVAVVCSLRRKLSR